MVLGGWCSNCQVLSKPSVKERDFQHTHTHTHTQPQTTKSPCIHIGSLWGVHLRLTHNRANLMAMAETTHRLHLVDTRTWEEQILKSSAHITGLVFSADGSKLYFGKPHGRPSINQWMNEKLTHAPPYICIYIGTTEGIFELSVLEKPASLAELCVDFIRSQPHISSTTTTTTTTSSSSPSSQLPGTN